MRVRMLVRVSGTRDGVDWPPRGGVVDVPDAEGAQMCAAGLSSPVAVVAPAEVAVPPPDAEVRARRAR